MSVDAGRRACYPQRAAAANVGALPAFVGQDYTALEAGKKGFSRRVHRAALHGGTLAVQHAARVASPTTSQFRGPSVADYAGLTVYLCLAAAIVAVIVVISGSLSPSRPSEAKARPYECGVSEMESTQHRWPVRFALVAMLFLVFDVEALFFYPWAVLVRELRWNGILAIAGFFAVLGVGYVYARARGALKWR